MSESAARIEADVAAHCRALAESAKRAARQLALSSTQDRDRALARMAELLDRFRDTIVAANERDVAAGRAAGLSAPLLDRLRLDADRVTRMAETVRKIAALPDPVGEVIDEGVRPNGLEVRKVRVPLGVVLFIYESRPNVTTDAAALCLKCGNAVILRGGTEARHSNQAIGQVIGQALAEVALPAAAVQVVGTTDRAAVSRLLELDGLIDVAIPRGGAELIRRVAAEAAMPVLKHSKGVCHVYLDASAALEMALAIVENAKCQRPGVCNAAETLLVHESAAARLLPAVAGRLQTRGVEIRGCPKTCDLVPRAVRAHEHDFGREFLDLVMAVRVVPDLAAAIEHIHQYGSGHTDAIVTEDFKAGRRFTLAVDSAMVLVNASTRFNDGGELGLGAEIGISTDKLHARGPCGLRELTSYKYIVVGAGQIRE